MVADKELDVMPTTRKFTVAEYYRMAEVGILRPDERVELIEGEVIKMCPIGPPHASGSTRGSKWLTTRLGDRVIVRTQQPIRLSDLTEPEPDLVLAIPEDKEYSRHHPTPDEVLLVIEVAASSLSYDREVKGRIYAESGIVQYCLLNLKQRQLEDHRDPEGDGYRTIRTYSEDESFSLAAFPDIAVPVSELLPKV